MISNKLGRVFHLAPVRRLRVKFLFFVRRLPVKRPNLVFILFYFLFSYFLSFHFLVLKSLLLFVLSVSSVSPLSRRLFRAFRQPSHLFQKPVCLLAGMELTR